MGSVEYTLAQRELPNELTQAEIPRMNQAVTAIRNQWLHRSFWQFLTAKGLDESVEKTIKLLFTEPDRFQFSEDANGTVKVRARKTGDTTIPANFDLHIQNGHIFRVMGQEIRYGKNVVAPKADWNNLEKVIETVTPKILDDSDTPDPMIEREFKWYEQYTLRLPRRILELLEMQPTLNSEETKVRDQLRSLMNDHPKTLGELDTGKTATIIALRREEIRLGIPGIDQDATPKGMVELAFFSGADAFVTFATISHDGKVIVKGK
jgi:hypothetical protein